MVQQESTEGDPHSIIKHSGTLLVQLSDQSSDAVESQKLEIKSWCHDDRQLADKVGEAAAFLANTDGGIVLVGVDDKRIGRDKFSPCLHRGLTPEWLVQRGPRPHDPSGRVLGHLH